MLKAFISLLMLTSFAFPPSQSSDQLAKENLKKQATEMMKAYLSEDFNTCVKYYHANLIKMAGGPTAMVEILKKSMNDFKTQGMKITKIDFDEPSVIIKKGTELQSTIMQRTEIKLNPGRVITASTLIAISGDQGKNWKFVDCGNNDSAKIRKLIPSLSSLINIPAKPPIQRFDN